MQELRVVGVRVELPGNQPILLLKETQGERYLPIWIGAVEAAASRSAEGVGPPAMTRSAVRCPSHGATLEASHPGCRTDLHRRNRLGADGSSARARDAVASPWHGARLRRGRLSTGGHEIPDEQRTGREFRESATVSPRTSGRVGLGGPHAPRPVSGKFDHGRAGGVLNRNESVATRRPLSDDPLAGYGGEQKRGHLRVRGCNANGGKATGARPSTRFARAGRDQRRTLDVSDQNDGSQGQLFSDAAVGAPAYDEVDTDLVGYRGPTACAAAGITYRQLDYWARTGLVAPSVRSATGSGTQRLYSFRDILVLKVVKRLLDTGVSLQNIRKAVDHLRTRGIKELSNITLFSDGATVYECTSAEEVVDLLAGGQGVFGIAVSGALRELSGDLAELPPSVSTWARLLGDYELSSAPRPRRHRYSDCVGPLRTAEGPSSAGGTCSVAPSGSRRGPRGALSAHAAGGRS